MKMSRYLDNCWVALLLAGVLTGCTQRESVEPVEQITETRHVFEGVVADSSCGATHKTDNAKQCTEACVAGGADYVLVIGEVVHELEGNAEELSRFAGERVEVSASLDGTTLKVARIGPVGQEG